VSWVINYYNNNFRHCCNEDLIVDDDPDLTVAFKMGLEGYHDANDERRFEYTHTMVLQ
jgi:hypothetical protein